MAQQGSFVGKEELRYLHLTIATYRKQAGERRHLKVVRLVSW